MTTPRTVFLIVTILLMSTPESTCHKTQFRVLGLQFATLNQRFELENKLLRDDIATAKADIQDLKTDSSRILQMFEIFTKEVRALKDELSQEMLKFQSLEMDLKTLQGEYEDFKDSSSRCKDKQNETQVDENNVNEVSTKSSHAHNGKRGEMILYDFGEENGLYAKAGVGPENESQNVYLFVTKYDDKEACFVSVHKWTTTRCTEHLGTGVRAIAVDQVQGKLYWSDDNRKLIMSSALNGSDETVEATNVTTLGLGLDSYHQVLFYTNVSGDIFRKTLIGNTSGSIWTNIGEKPRRIYVDKQNKILYAITNRWTGIVAINYSTNRREAIVEVQGRIKAMVVDSRNQMLYFSVNTSIYVKDLVDRATFAIFHGPSIPSDLILYGDYMYIVYYYLNKIDVMDLKTRALTHTIYIPWKGQGNTVSMALLQGY